jgi:hypothetical protein
MKKAVVGIGCLLFLSGCTSMHSPYDLYTMCMALGSTRLSSVGAKAQDRPNCVKELREDLEDSTPRILYVPKDIIMAPVLAARSLWVAVGSARPPF